MLSVRCMLWGIVNVWLKCMYRDYLAKVVQENSLTKLFVVRFSDDILMLLAV